MKESHNTPPMPTSRRAFLLKMTAASIGGLAAGVAATARAADDPKDHLLLNEPHVCRGLNTCKGKGAGGKNGCAGQGACATAEAHSCGGNNTCKGQSGCGSSPGENACSGKGDCAVPLSDKAWKKARKNFEKAAKKADITVGAAPKK